MQRKISVDFPGYLWEAVKIKAGGLGISVSRFIRDATEEKIERMQAPDRVDAEVRMEE